MQFTFLHIALGLASLSLTSARHLSLNNVIDQFENIAARAVSPDETCGASSTGNYTCPGTECCSAAVSYPSLARVFFIRSIAKILRGIAVLPLIIVQMVAFLLMGKL
jgi:hypothetical protein